MSALAAARRRRRLDRIPAGRLAAYVVLAIFVVVAVVPFLYVLSSSLKTDRALFSYPPRWITFPPDFTNYRDLLVEHPFLRWTLNTLFVATVVTTIKLVIDSMAAYALSKFEFVGRRVVFWLMLSMIMVPIEVLLVPLFFMIRDFGWFDTYWALILPALANPVGVFMLRAFIVGLPADVEHAARIDGANAFQVYRHVILPNIKPGLVVVGIYIFILQYTSFSWPLVATESEDMLVLTTGLSSLSPISFLRDWGLLSAAMILTLVPITLVFVLFQRHFMAVSLTGALKD
jgi:ABC-type glycerol-3-phosphate transport system permease component